MYASGSAAKKKPTGVPADALPFQVQSFCEYAATSSAAVRPSERISRADKPC
jgi:hypothetical protein